MNIPIVEPIEIGANQMLMVPLQGPGGPVRAPSGIPVVAKRNWKDPEFLTGAIQRPYSFRVKPCLDTHFNITFRPGKFKGGTPLQTQHGNFKHQKDGLLSQYYIQKTNPILPQASQFYPQLNSPIPMPS